MDSELAKEDQGVIRQPVDGQQVTLPQDWHCAKFAAYTGHYAAIGLQHPVIQVTQRLGVLNSAEGHEQRIECPFELRTCWQRTV